MTQIKSCASVVSFILILNDGKGKSQWVMGHGRKGVLSDGPGVQCTAPDQPCGLEPDWKETGNEHCY